MDSQHAIDEVIALLKAHYLNQKSGDFVQYKKPAELLKNLDLDRQDCQGDFDVTLKWIEKYLTFSLKTDHPSFVNRMWAGANLPSILGELTVAFNNTSACTYESAPVSTLMEKYMINQMLDLVGFLHGEGQMTTGSSNANMIAMMCARNLFCAQAKKTGLSGAPALVAFVNEDAHYSMDKAVNILGLGVDNLVKVPVNENGEMQVEALEKELDRCLGDGAIPFFVAATAGTTVRGAYDSVSEILELRKKHNFWLHVDGAWGGAVIMSDNLRQDLLANLEHADSFTCDFHKMLGSALMCNFLLINNKSHTLGTVLAGGDGSYLFRDADDNDVADLGAVSLQCGRRVDGLKWFLDWKFYGKIGFGERVESYLSLCQYAENVVNGSEELEMVVPRTSFNVCFRYKVEEKRANDFNQELRTRLYKQGITLVGIAFINEVLTLRLLIANLNIGKVEVDIFFDQLKEVGKALELEMA